jgi:hypothetical protein
VLTMLPNRKAIWAAAIMRVVARPGVVRDPSMHGHSLHGNAPQVSVESGRKMVPNEHMPSFVELEEAVQSVQIA